jgi:hypothetical protein
MKIGQPIIKLSNFANKCLICLSGSHLILYDDYNVMVQSQIRISLKEERGGRMVRMSDSQPEGRGFESRRGICEQDTLNPQLGVAIISRIKQNCLRHP